MSEIEYLKEELFCTKYELDAFAGIVLDSKAERWLPSFTGVTKDEDHLNRYELACKFVNNAKILDIACGAGKGSKLLATKGNALKVIGADINPDSVRYARHRYADPKISFIELDGLGLNMPNEFDVVISFETIEHIELFGKFVENIRCALIPGGKFIVSTPISSQSFDPEPLNPYHTQEWGFLEFQNVIRSAGFKIEKVFVQLDMVLKGPSLVQRIKKRLLYKKRNIRHYTGYSEKRIEEFEGQYNVNEFGTIRNGFQIVICTKQG